MNGRLCTVYRCSRKRELYVYMDMKASPDDLPEALRGDLGTLEPVLSLQLDPGRKLARASAPKVLEDIERQGFHLQLPPQEHMPPPVAGQVATDD